MRKLLWLLLCSAAFAQVSVSPAPPLHYQFFDTNGVPLANGKIFTYQAGTTTLQNTYADALGLSQNPDPIILDGSGATSNGSSPTGIFLASASYKFVAFNSNNVFQWSVDNISALVNVGVFSNPVQISDTICNQMVIGVAPNTYSLCWPTPTAPVVLSFPTLSANDTLLAQSAAATETNKTLTSPAITNPVINQTVVANSPGTYFIQTNAASVGTTVNTLTKFTGAPSTAVIAATSDVSGIVGICVANCGITGIASIQQSGQAFCVFDGATVAGHLVQISNTVAGDCQDAGSSILTRTQPIGISVSTNGAAGTYVLNLFAPTTLGTVGNVGGTPSVSTGGAAGTGGSCSLVAGGKDRMGSVTCAVGTAPVASSTLFTVTFSAPFPTQGSCVIYSSNPTTPTTIATNVFVSSGSNYFASFNAVTNGVAMTASTTYNFTYLCNGY